MIIILSGMCAWMAFYISWQITRQRPPVPRILACSLYSISAAFLTYGISLNEFYGNRAAAGTSEDVHDIVTQALPAIITGAVFLLIAVALEVHIRRKNKLRRTKH